MEQSESFSEGLKNEPAALIEIRATSGEVLGTLWLDGAELRFEGKVDEAAREFFDFLLKLWNDRPERVQLVALCENWEVEAADMEILGPVLVRCANELRAIIGEVRE